MAVQAQKVFLFNLATELLGEYHSAATCADAVGAKRQAVNAAVKRGSVLLGRYYVGGTARFAPPQQKKKRNPLQSIAVRRDAVRQEPAAFAKGLGKLKAVLLSDADIQHELTEGYLFGY